MNKQLHNNELDLSVENWWRELDMNEQNLLITMLYNMNGEDFRVFGVEIDETGDKYIKVKR